MSHRCKLDNNTDFIRSVPSHRSAVCPTSLAESRAMSCTKAYTGRVLGFLRTVCVVFVQNGQTISTLSSYRRSVGLRGHDGPKNACSCIVSRYLVRVFFKGIIFVFLTAIFRWSKSDPELVRDGRGSRCSKEAFG